MLGCLGAEGFRMFGCSGGGMCEGVHFVALASFLELSFAFCAEIYVLLRLTFSFQEYVL